MASKVWIPNCGFHRGAPQNPAPQYSRELRSAVGLSGRESLHLETTFDEADLVASKLDEPSNL